VCKTSDHSLTPFYQNNYSYCENDSILKSFATLFTQIEIKLPQNNVFSLFLIIFMNFLKHIILFKVIQLIYVWKSNFMFFIDLLLDLSRVPISTPSINFSKPCQDYTSLVFIMIYFERKLEKIWTLEKCFIQINSNWMFR
jgi:hypothetical protein